MRRIKRIISLTAPVFFVFVAAAAATETGNKTLQNLQSAYNGESNAHAKYLEFAKQADSEGYGKVGSLFRAAAAAEEIHRTCEAAVIKEMGATPRAEVKLPPIKSTKENLEESANQGEAYERDTMYPRFIKQAQIDGNARAAKCFAYAQAAEAEHFNLFRTAAAKIQEMKGGPATFYVCNKDGFTMAEADAGKCPGGEYQEIK